MSPGADRLLLLAASLVSWIGTIDAAIDTGFVPAAPSGSKPSFGRRRRSARRPASPSDDAAAGGDGDVRARIEGLLSLLGGDEERGDAAADAKVHIIGTGLSDKVSSLPLPALSVLSRADVVLHDALSLPPDEIRRVVPESCIVRAVGKRGGDATSANQSDIDALLLRYAADDAVATVVRLKGGDPFLFGRTRTEIDALRTAGAKYDVAPGLTSCVAGPHRAGIPLTDPTVGARSFAVFSGTDARGRGAGEEAEAEAEDGDGGRRRDWGGVDVDALVFLMIGRLDKLGDLCASIARGGGGRWDEATLCAVVRSAGRPSQRVWRATLGTMVEEIERDVGKSVASVSPAVLVVGPTASLDLLAQ